MLGDRTTNLQTLINRLKAGDELARWELVENADGRLRGLAATILNDDFGRVKKAGLCTTTELTARIKERMVNALAEVELNDVQHFFRLAALRIRWLLLDEAKRMPKRKREKRQEAVPAVPELNRRPHEEVMAKVLEIVEGLPADQQEVVYLYIWRNWTEVDIAKELGVATKTVQRRLTRAQATLGRSLREWLEEQGNSGA